MTIALTTASTIAPPTWNDVLTRPDASPCSWLAIPAVAWMFSDGKVSAIVTSQTGSATDPASLLDGYRPALAVVTLVAALGLLVGFTGILSRGRVLAMAE